MRMTTKPKQPAPFGPTSVVSKAPPPPPVKPMPKWLTVGVVIVFALASSWLIWHQWNGAGSDGEKVVLEDGDMVPRGPAALARRFAPPPEGVKYNRNRDQATVRAGDVEMRVTLPGAKKKEIESSIYYARGDYMTPEQTKVLAARTRLATDSTAAKYAGVSKEQQKALKQIGWPAMQVSDADRAQMKGLWTAYANAQGAVAQSAAEKGIVEALKQMGDSKLEGTKALVAERCAQITGILSSEQLEKFQTMGKPQASKQENVAVNGSKN